MHIYLLSISTEVYRTVFFTYAYEYVTLKHEINEFGTHEKYPYGPYTDTHVRIRD